MRGKIFTFISSMGFFLCNAQNPIIQTKFTADPAPLVWTDHGVVASLQDFKWLNTDNGAWALQCVERAGKFYLYCPVPNGMGIGVLVGDSPYGPLSGLLT